MFEEYFKAGDMDGVFMLKIPAYISGVPTAHQIISHLTVLNPLGIKIHTADHSLDAANLPVSN